MARLTMDARSLLTAMQYQSSTVIVSMKLSERGTPKLFARHEGSDCPMRPHYLRALIGELAAQGLVTGTKQPTGDIVYRVA